MSDFNEMLRYLRYRAGLSQSELAKALNVSKSTISMYELGSRKPSLEMMETFADFFNVDMNFLHGKISAEEPAQQMEQFCDLFSMCYGKDSYSVVQKFLKLDKTDRIAVSAVIDGLLSTDKYKKDKCLLVG